MSGLLIAGLILFEFFELQRVHWKPELVVDQSRQDRMTINFDISFPRIPCFAMTLDVMDAANDFQNNLVEDITKMRLDPAGTQLGEYKDVSVTRPADYCGSCYNAHLIGPGGKPICCNSCSSVFAAYEHQNLPPPSMDKIEQCTAENWPQKIKESSREGCRVSGHFQINKVAGNFHFAPGRSYDAFNFHLHDTRFLEGMILNFSHKVHYLSFGERHEEIVNPLDGLDFIADSPQHVFKYKAKVVAAEFKYRNGKILYSNQFAVTRDSNPIRGDKNAFPSVVFDFDISPMVVVYTEYKKPLAAFLTGICAIIGGVYTVAAIIDAAVFHAERSLRQKMAMGKVN